MKRKITIRGRRVHEVGYRVSLINAAVNLGFDNFTAFNSTINGYQAVICLLEGDEDQVNGFIEWVRGNIPERAEVTSIEAEEYEGKVPSLERTMAAFQMEHWGKAIPILLDVRDEIMQVREAVCEEGRLTREELGRKIDSVREELGRRIDAVREELGGKIDSVREAVREEGRLTREALQDIIMREIEDIKSRISRLEARVK